MSDLLDWHLNPLPVDTPKGEALCFAWKSTGFGEHNLWHTFILATGQPWTFQNPEIRVAKNYTAHIRDVNAKQ